MYRIYYDLISKFQVGLKSLLRHGLLEPEFYGELVYKLKKIVASNNFSVVNQIMVGNFAFLFNCMLVGQTSDSTTVPT